MRTFRARVFSLSVIFLLVTNGAVVVAEDVPGASPAPFVLEVLYDHATDELSIRAHQAPLEAVLAEIARKTRLSLELPSEESFGEQISVELDRLSVENALKTLLRGFNWVFSYAPAGTGNDEEISTPALAKAVVLSKKVAKLLEPRGPKEESSLETKSRHYAQLDLADVTQVIRHLVNEGPAAVKAVVDALREPAREQERERIIEALLGQLDNEEVPPPDGVIVALRELALDRAIDALVAQLQETNPRLQANAAATLGRLQDERAVEPLSWALNATHTEARRAVATSLSLIGGPRAMGVLLDAYQAGDNTLRYPVWLAIVSHGDAQSQHSLRRLIAAGHAPPEPTARTVATQNGTSK
ncbi:MAG: HEAT repeat domain-containing protein [Candidatus Rokubacteria bacterium]|nr:HEAT repeat domain-containing protein [Candidatus Rokubacteria bacterium]